MPNEKPYLLVVNDDASVPVLSGTLAEFGFKVRQTEDGFSAPVELRNGVPDILLSDLNMPGMSGLELLSVVRRRFPAVRVIAMSSVYSRDGIPPGVAADAYYEKTTNFSALLSMVEAMSQPDESPPAHPRGALSPIWVPRNGRDLTGEPCVIITCLECLRTFAQVLDESKSPFRDIGCVYCHSSIQYTIVPRTEPAPIFQRNPGTGMPTPLALPELT